MLNNTSFLSAPFIDRSIDFLKETSLGLSETLWTPTILLVTTITAIVFAKLAGHAYSSMSSLYDHYKVACAIEQDDVETVRKFLDAGNSVETKIYTPSCIFSKPNPLKFYVASFPCNEKVFQLIRDRGVIFQPLYPSHPIATYERPKDGMCTKRASCKD